MKNLPQLDHLSLEHSQRVLAHLQNRIQQKGWIPFSEWMQECLYAPSLGYYVAGNLKFAQNNTSQQGDFITAPQLSPLFAWALAQQSEEILNLSQSNHILEFGAGTGELAYGILSALKERPEPVHYFILDISGELRARQQQRLAPFAHQVTWLETLPEHFCGCIIANEVLDAMPVELVQRNTNQGIERIGVTLNHDHQPIWQTQTANGLLAKIACERLPEISHYRSEVNLQAESWMRQLADWLERGAAILIDYGFPQHEYYHPERQEGTLMCHLRHMAHDNPLLYPGIQDITSHVDFTAMADAAYDAGLSIFGYTSQAHFLMNLGILEAFSQCSFDSPAQQSLAGQALQKLLSEAEMGELFKVLAVGKNIATPQRGFLRGDRLSML